MAYYDTVGSYHRTELGVPFVCWVKAGGYTELVATNGITDMPAIFDHTAFATGKEREAELRNALRRHARWVKSKSAE